MSAKDKEYDVYGNRKIQGDISANNLHESIAIKDITGAIDLLDDVKAEVSDLDSAPNSVKGNNTEDETKAFDVLLIADSDYTTWDDKKLVYSGVIKTFWEMVVGGFTSFGSQIGAIQAYIYGTIPTLYIEKSTSANSVKGNNTDDTADAEDVSITAEEDYTSWADKILVYSGALKTSITNIYASLGNKQDKTPTTTEASVTDSTYIQTTGNKKTLLSTIKSYLTTAFDLLYMPIGNTGSDIATSSTDSTSIADTFGEKANITDANMKANGIFSVTTYGGVIPAVDWTASNVDLQSLESVWGVGWWLISGQRTCNLSVTTSKGNPKGFAYTYQLEAKVSQLSATVSIISLTARDNDLSYIAFFNGATYGDGTMAFGGWEYSASQSDLDDYAQTTYVDTQDAILQNQIISSLKYASMGLDQYVDLTISAGTNTIDSATYEIAVSSRFNNNDIDGAIVKTFGKNSTTETRILGDEIADAYYIQELSRTSASIVVRVHSFTALSNDVTIGCRVLNAKNAIATPFTFTLGSVTDETAITEREVATYSNTTDIDNKSANEYKTIVNAGGSATYDLTDYIDDDYGLYNITFCDSTGAYWTTGMVSYEGATTLSWREIIASDNRVIAVQSPTNTYEIRVTNSLVSTTLSVGIKIEKAFDL